MMKTRKVFVAALIVVALGLLLKTVVSAQEGVTTTPAQLSVAGTRGRVETRTLLIRASEPLTELKAIPLDLARADGEAVLPAGAINASLPSDAVETDGLLTIPVTVDLRGVPGGKFSGELLLNHHGGTLTVPATVTVKDRWPLPLVVLFVGVALSVGVSAYRARGRPRDQVLVRVGQLRTQMRGDEKVAKPFQDRITSRLMDVEAALQAEKWEEAQAAIEQAEATWVKWRQGRADWQAQIAYHGELMERLANEPDVPYVQALRRELEDALRDAPDLKGPDELQKRLDDLAKQINDYVRLRGKLDELNQLRNRLPADQDESWRLKAQDFERRLQDLSPGDDEAYQALASEIDAAIAELREIPPREAPIELAAKGVRGPVAVALRLLGPAPAARALSEEQLEGAHNRLWWFKAVGYAIAVVLLAGAGFGELYVANATFGASPWGDYFALLVWGFGAEATRSAVTEMVRSWELPGLE